MSKSLKRKVYNQVKIQVHIMNLNIKVHNQVEGQVYDQVNAQVKNKVWYKMLDQVGWFGETTNK